MRPFDSLPGAKGSGGAFDIAARAALAIAVGLGAGGAAQAGEGTWSLQLEPMYMAVYGHDPHVLTVHEFDLDATPTADSKTGVNLETDSGPAYRTEFRYTRNQWGWGLDFFWFNTSQKTPDRTAAAGGAIDAVAFEVADRTFTSANPGEVLFYRLLEDTDLIAWTVDLYAIRTLAEKPESNIHLLVGIRNADFDNDFHAVVGVENGIGRRVDASSNYGRMIGPLVGLEGDARRGRNAIKAAISQSLIIGEAELSTGSSEFIGPFSDTVPFFATERFKKKQDVGIPITEFRLKWTYRISDRIALGLGTHTSAWWDIPVPPGVQPIEDGDEVLHENTIVFFGVLGAVEFTF